MTIKAWFVAFLCCSGMGLAVVDPDHPPEPAPGRIDIAWVASKPLGTVRLQGRFVISALNGNVSTSVSNRASPNVDTSQVEVPPGLYSVTLDEGFELQREGPGAEPSGSSGSLAPSPVLVLAQAGHTTHVALAIGTRPEQPEQPEPVEAAEAFASATCIN
jgi:hypothetical protein